MLADDFPEARVVTFGYDASVAKFSRLWRGVDTSGLADYGKNLAHAVRNTRQAVDGEHPVPALDVPIYFIGHSLGGLVIQQALVESLGGDESLLPVATRTAGIIFMGTPHHGASLASWAVKLRDAFRILLPIWSNNINGEVLKLLETKSDICKKVQIQFQTEGRGGRLKGLKMFSFYETVPMVAAGKIVVTKDSAVLSELYCEGIASTHSDMVKFSGKRDVAYQKVLGQFRVWMKGAVRIDKVNEEKKTEDPDHLEGWPGEDGQKRKKKEANSAFAYGARIGTISGTTGGTINLQTSAVGGDFIDMSHARGRVIGKVIYQRDDVADQFGNSDQWANCDEELDEENEAEENA